MKYQKTTKTHEEKERKKERRKKLEINNNKRVSRPLACNKSVRTLLWQAR